MAGPNREIPIGLHAIIAMLDLKVPPPYVRSMLASGARRTRITASHVLEHYPQGYEPAKGVVGQLRFALRYEPLALDVYKAACHRMDRIDLERWIQGEPNSIYARRAWYLYELFTGTTLDVDDLTSGPYIDLLNPVLQVVGPSTRIRRQRIFDNLLGNKDYCPLIRRTDVLTEAFAKNLPDRARAMVAGVDPAVLKRAVHYLFVKETRSSFAIEGEAPSATRTDRFMTSLLQADTFDASQKRALLGLQNSIVDPRYAQKDWRDLQVYVGETLPDYSQLVHFVCPRPCDLPSLMDGWMRMVARLLGPESPAHAVCAAAAAAFGFAFIHPFEDGNGRIHRFLVHNVLSKMNFTPPGSLFPVSAVMLRNRVSYDRCLEAFSSGIAPFAPFTMDADQTMRVQDETADLYRYFDATPQAEYLFACIEETIARDLKYELEFLTFFDGAMKATREIVDMPDRRASLLIRLINQNHGRLAKGKRAVFAELTDEEVGRIEAVIAACAAPCDEPEATGA